MSDVTSDKKQEKADPVVTLLAVVGIMAPLAGYVWGPGQWWQYVIWLAVGVTVTAGYASHLDKDEA